MVNSKHIQYSWLSNISEHLGRSLWSGQRPSGKVRRIRMSSSLLWKGGDFSPSTRWIKEYAEWLLVLYASRFPTEHAEVTFHGNLRCVWTARFGICTAVSSPTKPRTWSFLARNKNVRYPKYLGNLFVRFVWNNLRFSVIYSVDSFHF